MLLLQSNLKHELTSELPFRGLLSLRVVMLTIYTWAYPKSCHGNQLIITGIVVMGVFLLCCLICLASLEVTFFPSNLRTCQASAVQASQASCGVSKIMFSVAAHFQIWQFAIIHPEWCQFTMITGGKVLEGFQHDNGAPAQKGFRDVPALQLKIHTMHNKGIKVL